MWYSLFTIHQVWQRCWPIEVHCLQSEAKAEPWMGTARSWIFQTHNIIFLGPHPHFVKHEVSGSLPVWSGETLQKWPCTSMHILAVSLANRFFPLLVEFWFYHWTPAPFVHWLFHALVTLFARFSQLHFQSRFLQEKAAEPFFLCLEEIARSMPLLVLLENVLGLLRCWAQVERALKRLEAFGYVAAKVSSPSNSTFTFSP